MSTPAPQLRPAARTKAQIKRASAAARRAANRLDARQLAELEQRYRQAAAELDAAIMARAGETGNLRLEVLEDLRGQVDGILTRLGRDRDAQLDNGLYEAAELGVQPFDGAVAGTRLSRVPEEAVQFVYNFVSEEDGFQLSDRLWRLDRGARRQVSEAIEQAVLQGHSASQAASDFLSRGEAVPADVQAKINQAAGARVSRLAGAALLRDEGNARQNALRVFRTELNRAHGEAYMMGGEEHPDFAGWRFLLSPRHPRVDICDMHANANNYGLGPGVYPSREATPWPAHPNTLSYTEIVFVDEISEADREGQQDRIEWLKQQPPGVQEGVLNSRKKAAALREGLLKENQIATPWKVLKERYKRQGIDVDALGGTPSDGFTPVVRPSPRGVPVSNGLEPQAYKQVSNTTLEAIDRVHGDGELPVIPIKRSSSRRRFGYYQHIPAVGRPVDIGISQYGDHKHLTLAHEVGHFLDDQALRRGWSSVSDDRFAGWRRAVDESAAIGRLKELASGPARVPVEGLPIPVPKAHINYLLQRHEIWARSYAQYIALRSGQAELIDELNALRRQQDRALVRLPSQWDDKDFEPVAAEIDKLFNELGWSRGGS